MADEADPKIRIKKRGPLESSVNGKYYADIFQPVAMAADYREQHVRNLIQGMIDKGNADYYDAFGEEIYKMHPKEVHYFTLGREEKFKAGLSVVHEMLHLGCQAPHTMRIGEQNISAAQAVLLKGAKAVTLKAAVSPVEKRKFVLSAAFGLYFGDRWRAFREEFGALPPPATALEAKARHDAQLEWIKHYQANDLSHIDAAKNYAQTKLDMWKETDAEAQVLLDAPYQLVELSPQERSALIEVALGIKKPEQTPYKNRLSLVKQALVDNGLDYEWGQHRERWESTAQQPGAKSDFHR